MQETRARFPGEEEQVQCPRCESKNTKFCYYNNYNLSQPRHFCKNCKRYWTKGGSLRNIPVGGGTRKNNSKRASKPKKPDQDSHSARPARRIQDPLPFPQVGLNRETGDSGRHPDRKVLDVGGSFSSLLGGGQFGNFFDGSGLKMDGFEEGSGNSSNNGGGNSNNNNNNLGLDLELEGSGNSNNEGYLQSGDWGTGNGWPDLAIYTPNPTFQ